MVMPTGYKMMKKGAWHFPLSPNTLKLRKERGQKEENRRTKKKIILAEATDKEQISGSDSSELLRL